MPAERITLGQIAHARSGDKGNHANIAVVAHCTGGYDFLREELTAERVGDYFRSLGASGVQRYELPNLWALNFVLRDALAGGASQSLRIDTQGKQSQMSGRSGLYVNADAIIDLLEEKILAQTIKRNSDLDKETLQNIAHSIAVGTIRYEMIKQDLDKIITFDFKKSLSLEGDTSSYIQYAFVRSSRILEKSDFSSNKLVSFDLLTDEYEIKLIKTIGSFDKHVNDASVNLSPKVIARYCYDLAVSFNAFYEHVHVLSNENLDLTRARLFLVFCFQSTLKKSLELLGITAPSRM